VEFGKDADLDTLISLLRNEKISEEGFTPTDYDEQQYVYLWNDTGSREELIEEFYYTIFSGKEEAENAWNSEDNYLKEHYDFHYDSCSYIDIIQKPKIGIPLAKRVYINMNGEFWDTAARSAEYKTHQDELTHLAAEDLSGVYIQFSGFSEHINLNDYSPQVVIRETHAVPVPVTTSSTGSSYNREEIRKILEEILPYYCTYDPANRDSGVIIGNLELSGQYYKTIPIYTDNLEVVNGICRILNIVYGNDKSYVPYPEFSTVEDFYDYYAETCIRAISIIDSETGEIRQMSPEQFRDLIPSMAYLRERGYSNVDEYLRIYDSRYWINVSFENPYALGEEEYHNTRTLYLREGAVTDEILAEIFNLCK
jgi:hypothetical protein